MFTNNLLIILIFSISYYHLDTSVSTKNEAWQDLRAAGMEGVRERAVGATAQRQVEARLSRLPEGHGSNLICRLYFSSVLECSWFILLRQFRVPSAVVQLHTYPFSPRSSPRQVTAGH